MDEKWVYLMIIKYPQHGLQKRPSGLSASPYNGVQMTKCAVICFFSESTYCGVFIL